MIKLRERLDTLEALNDAIEGYQHLPIETLSQFLLDNYTVDLDLLAQFSDTGAAPREDASSEKKQSAA